MNYFKVASMILTIIFSVQNGFAHEGHQDVYTDCELTGKVIFVNGICTMPAKGCRRNGGKVIAPGKDVMLVCDAMPQLSRGLPLRAGCPDIDECSNDIPRDDKVDYSGSVTWIVTDKYREWRIGSVYEVQENYQRPPFNTRITTDETGEGWID